MISSRPLRLAAVLALGLTVSACAQAENAPQSATVIIEASPANPLQLIVSTRFEVPTAGVVEFVNSDTIMVTGNFNETYAMNEDARFTAQIGNFVEDAEEVVRMSVLLDGGVQYDETATLLTGGFLQYLYRFRGDVGIVF